jgi:hypothetical protein
MYSLSTTKKIIALAAIIASFSIAAETKEQAQIDAVDTEAVTNPENDVSELANNEEEITEQAMAEEEVTELVNSEKEITELAIVEEEASEIVNAEEETTESTMIEEVTTELVNAEEETTEPTMIEEVATDLAMAEEEATVLAMVEEDFTEVKIIEEKSSVKNNTNTNIHTCPSNFYDVKLPTNGKLCQVFATDLPASMIFFVPQLPEEVIAFYEQDTATFSTTRQVKDRVLLQSEDKNTTLIISTDGSGTQVDVLVKSSNS